MKTYTLINNHFKTKIHFSMTSILLDFFMVFVIGIVIGAYFF